MNQAPTNKPNLYNSYMYLISTEKAACLLFSFLLSISVIQTVGLMNQAPTKNQALTTY